MSNLTGTQIQNTYGGVINIGPSGATGSLQPLTDGFGTTLPIEISTTGVNFTGTVTGVNPPLAILDEGNEIVAAATGINFIGGSVSVSAVGSVANVTITAGAGTSGTSGVSGSSGSSGTSGINGNPGTPGSSGTSLLGFLR